jgi:hypothetical protein
MGKVVPGLDDSLRRLRFERGGEANAWSRRRQERTSDHTDVVPCPHRGTHQGSYREPICLREFWAEVPQISENEQATEP